MCECICICVLEFVFVYLYLYLYLHPCWRSVVVPIFTDGKFWSQLFDISPLTQKRFLFQNRCIFVCSPSALPFVSLHLCIFYLHFIFLIICISIISSPTTDQRICICIAFLCILRVCVFIPSFKVIPATPPIDPRNMSKISLQSSPLCQCQKPVEVKNEERIMILRKETRLCCKICGPIYAHWIFESPGILQSRQAGCTAGRWLGQRWWGRSSWSARFRSLASCPPGSVSRSTFCRCWFSKLLNIYMEFDVDVEFTCNSLTTVRKGPGIGNSARHTPRWCCTPYPAQRHHHHHQ